MEFVQLKLYPYRTYAYDGSSSAAMDAIGCFLKTDVGCPANQWKDWILDDALGTDTTGNITRLEKNNDHIAISSLYDPNEIPARLNVSRQSLIHLLDEWQEKVCKNKPKTVTIIYDNDIFTINTSN